MGSVLWKVSCEAEIKVVLGKKRERERDKSDAVAT